MSNVEEDEEHLEGSYSGCWDEYKMVQPLCKNILVVSNKVKHTLFIPLFGIYPREKNLCARKNLYSNIYSSFICNCQKLETISSTGE